MWRKDYYCTVITVLKPPGERAKSFKMRNENCLSTRNPIPRHDRLATPDATSSARMTNNTIANAAQ